MKKLEVTVSAADSDHVPVNGAWKMTIISQTPFLTAGQIVRAVENVAQAEGCKVELKPDVAPSG
jgi:hypothetical protein